MNQKAWLCLPFVVLSAADGIATLIGQPPDYWQGAFPSTEEFNPIAHWLMNIHPFAFLVGGLALIVLVSIVILVLPVKSAKIISAFLIMAHTNGVANWLLYTFHVDHFVYNATMLLSAILMIYAFTKSDEFNKTRDNV